jgi:hypothetical protein
MNNNKRPIDFSLLALAALVLPLLLSACSDSGEEPRENAPLQQNAEVKKSPAPAAFDHGHDNEVSDLVKHKFEHDFAEQCVEREVQSSVNKEQDRERFAKPCMCIAQYLMKNLTAKEAELFVDEHKNTQSLRIRYEAAAYNCLQKKAQGQQNQAPVIVQQQ